MTLNFDPVTRTSTITLTIDAYEDGDVENYFHEVAERIAEDLTNGLYSWIGWSKSSNEQIQKMFTSMQSGINTRFDAHLEEQS